MFEHVGINFYDAFFAKCAATLADDGVMVLHSIGRSTGPSSTNAWIAKYIFPGGYIPALSEVMPAIERAGLLVTDIEILRLHYAETLKAWRDRFLAHRAEVERIYDARFVRMWEFYLACSEIGVPPPGHDGVPSSARPSVRAWCRSPATTSRRRRRGCARSRAAAHAAATCRRVSKPVTGSRF